MVENKKDLFMNLNEKQRGNSLLRFPFVVLLAVILVVSFIGDTVFAQTPVFNTKIPTTNILKAESLNRVTINNAVMKENSEESRIETFTISIPQLGDRQRNIQVYLPPDYDASDKAYPVFYLHAGQYLFNPPPEAVGDYKVDEKLDRLFAEGLIDGVIVVGIEIDYEHDWDEDSPWVNEDMRDWVSASASDPSAGGEGFAFVDFIVNTLKPEIDSQYRTLTNRENTAIGGFCKNGLLPVVAGIKYSNVFSKVMTMSPAVWFAEGGGRWLSNNRLINYIKENPTPENVKFYVDIGTEESSGRRPSVRDQNGKRITYPQAYVEGAQALVNVLRDEGVPDSNIYFKVIEGSSGTRDERAKNLDDVFLWFFSKEHVEPQPEPADDSSAAEPPMDENNQDENEEQDKTIFLPGIQESENPEEAAGSSGKTIILISSAFLVILFALFLFLRKG